MQEEKKSYERQLRRCKTKEEVERVRVNKINGYLAQAKSISHNAVIPKGEKKAMLEEIMARLTNMEKVHAKFVKSEQYRKMPREQEIAKERAELQSDRQEAVTEMLKETGEEQEELVESERAEGVPIEKPEGVARPGNVSEGMDVAGNASPVEGETSAPGVQPGEIPADTEVEKTPAASTDDLAKKAMNVIQTALSSLNKFSYNSSGSTVSIELDRDTGKRIDVKK